MANTDGYIKAFIGNGALAVNPPSLGASIKGDLFKINGTVNGQLDYFHYSLCMNAKRKFCFFSAANVDAGNFKSVTRKSLFPPDGTDKWKRDTRAGNIQWGLPLYNAPKSGFDRGHMTRREDPQWGTTEKTARSGALSTFNYTNAVPQHKNLNQKIWGSLEDYILHTEAEPNHLKVNVITGPVLAPDDPFFVTEVSGEQVQLPVLFWKIVYYTNDGKNLSRAAFMMGHRDLLLKNKIVKPFAGKAFIHTKAPDFFQDYKDKAIFQVNVSTIEKLTDLTFHPAEDPYKDSRPLELITEQVQAKRLIKSKLPLKTSFKNIVLK